MKKKLASVGIVTVLIFGLAVYASNGSDKG